MAFQNLSSVFLDFFGLAGVTEVHSEGERTFVSHFAIRYSIDLPARRQGMESHQRGPVPHPTRHLLLDNGLVGEVERDSPAMR